LLAISPNKWKREREPAGTATVGDIMEISTRIKSDTRKKPDEGKEWKTNWIKKTDEGPGLEK